MIVARTRQIITSLPTRWRVYFNPIESRGNYSATSNNMKLVHWPLMGGLLYLVQQGGDWAGPQGQIQESALGGGHLLPSSPSPFAVPNVTAHPLTASVPITVLLYNGPLLCSFNVGTKGLSDDLLLKCY